MIGGEFVDITSVMSGVNRNFNILYTEIHILCLFMLAFVAYKEKHSPVYTLARTYNIRLANSAIIMILSSVIAKWNDMGMLSINVAFASLLNVLYFAFNIMLYYYLLLYINYVAGVVYTKRQRYILCIPFILTLALHVINLKTGFLYQVYYDTLHEQLNYTQSGYYILGLIVPYSMVLVNSLQYLVREFRNFRMGRVVNENLQQVQHLALAIVLAGFYNMKAEPIPLYPVVIAFGLFIHYFHEVESEALLDPLTKVYNKREFFHMLGNLKENYLKGDTTNLYLIMIDVNDFKKINDTYGHEIGDLSLIYIADTMKRALAPYKDPKAYGYRFGGDEFAIIMRTDDEGEIDKMMSSFIELHKTFDEGIDVHITLSYGYCVYESWMDTKEFLSKVDAVLYENKKNYHASLKKNKRCVEATK